MQQTAFKTLKYSKGGEMNPMQFNKAPPFAEKSLGR